MLLLLVSLFFYAWGEKVYVLLLLASIAANWWLGLRVEPGRKHRRIFLTTAVVLNLTGCSYSSTWASYVKT